MPHDHLEQGFVPHAPEHEEQPRVHALFKHLERVNRANCVFTRYLRTWNNIPYYVGQRTAATPQAAAACLPTRNAGHRQIGPDHE